MSSVDYILKEVQKYHIVSIIGLAKNVSKTTTLNFLIRNLKNRLKLGLTSIGRDGESYDVITKLPKPRIHVVKDILVATAEQVYMKFKNKLEVLIETNYNTPLGRILILKVLKDFHIELAGPSINNQLYDVCKSMLKRNCDLVLIDGAFDRKSYATPKISDATILSTGASVSRNIKNVVNLTKHIVDLLTTESEENIKVLENAIKIIKKAKVGIIYSDGTHKELNLLTALGSANEILKHMENKLTHIVINGVITDLFLESFMNKSNLLNSITFLVQDATKLFISSRIFQKFISKGGKIKVIFPIKLIAITINPTSPYGYNFDKEVFINMLKKKIELPVYDLAIK